MSKSKMVKKILLVCTILSSIVLVVAVSLKILTNTSDLPRSCARTFALSVPDKCHQDIQAKAATLNTSHLTCYDNNDYVDCNELVHDAVGIHITIIISFIATIALGSSWIVARSHKRTRK